MLYGFTNSNDKLWIDFVLCLSFAVFQIIMTALYTETGVITYAEF